MEKIIKKKIGREVHVFTVSADNLHELLMKEKELSFPNEIPSCGLCGSDNLELGAHITAKKKFAYCTIRCKNCRGAINMGQQTENKNIFYLKMIETGEKDKNGKPVKKYDWRTAEQQKLSEDNDQ